LGYLLGGQFYFALRNPFKAYNNFGNFRIYGPVPARLVSAAYQHHTNVNTAAATALVDALLCNI
jgi:hypothetical protein